MRISLSGNTARLAVLMAVALAGAACSDTSDVPMPTILSINAGVDGQTGVVNQPVPTPVSVHIVDQFGAAMATSPVTWTVRSGGGHVSQTTTVTNFDGDATTVWTLGPTVGPQSLQATTSNALIRIINVTAVAATGQ